MNNTTIPKQHYVTIQYRKDVTSESSHLGFASPYTKDAAFKKRKETQDRWAYGGATVNIDENDDITVTGGGRQGGYGHMEVDASTLFMTNCYPLITNNDPIEGFQISQSVRRSGSWGGGGNVLWRIADPRGFELEISSANFANVLNCVTIVNGVIQGKCVWGRNGKDNILLPEASDVYQEATKLTSKISKNISLKDVKVGDTVELLLKNKRKEENEDTYQYLGKYFFLTVTQEREDGDRYYGGNGTFKFNKSQVERYLLKSVSSGEYMVLSTPKILSIVTPIETPLNKTEIAKEATAWLDRKNGLREIDNLILISPTKIKMEEVSTQLVPLDEAIVGNWPKVDTYHTDTIISEFESKFWLSSKEQIHNRTTHTYDDVPTLKEVTLDIGQNKIALRSLVTSSGSWYNRGHHREYVIRKDFAFDQLKLYRIEVTANGITGKVYRLGYY